MRNLSIAIIIGAATVAATAQDTVTVDMLIAQGFEVKSAYGVPSYSQLSVLYLQKGPVLYICSVVSSRGGTPQPGEVGAARCGRV